MAVCRATFLCLVAVCLMSVSWLSSVGVTAANIPPETHGTADRENSTEHENGTGHSEGHSGGVKLAGFNFEEVKTPLVISLVIILAAGGKLAFHHADFLASKLPESCLLIVIGVILGAILHFSGAANHLPDFFAPHEFFLYLLPPIILEASYSLHDRAFFNNLGGILLFAVVGTVIACFTVGYTLYGLGKVGGLGPLTQELGATEVLIFAALIVAVDPVAVLAVFEEVGVNSVLYFLVFGESLLNDGVTVVIYKVMQELNEMETITGLQVFLGFLAFFVVAGGGLILGIFFGVLSALVTKYTNSVRVVEPIAVFGFAYLSYVMAELFEFSGIISIIACGLMQMQYTFHNITEKSRTTIKYFTKVIATTNEIIIFLFLGLALVRPDHDFHVGFVLWTVFLTLFYRVLITYGLTFLLNRFDRNRVRQISLEEQFIISYGGLRGAVCFSLVAMLDKEQVPQKPMFVTTTLAVVIFTVFIQGISIKPLVRLLHITLAPKDEPTLYEELNSQVTDHLMAGMEDIVGFRGKYYLKEVLEYYDDKYLKKLLQRNPGRADGYILEIYGKLALRDHVENLYACRAATIPNSPSIAKAIPRSRMESEFILNRLSYDSRRSQDSDTEFDFNLLRSFSSRNRQSRDSDIELLKTLSDGSQGRADATYPGADILDAPSNSRSMRQPSVLITPAENEAGEQLLNTGEVEIEMNSPPFRRNKRGRKGSPEIRTYKDLRKHLVKNPSRVFMHMKHDPNLSREDKTDLLQLMQEKHARNRRLQEHAVSKTPALERCMSWGGAQEEQRSIDEANARLRHYKAMSVDVNALNGETRETNQNQLLGGAAVRRAKQMPQIPEKNDSPKSEGENEGEEGDRDSSELKRLHFKRANATMED